MRLVGTLKDPSQAERFAWRLERLGIGHRQESKDGLIEIWVYSEDRVAEAAREFAEYVQDPSAAKYDIRPERRDKPERARQGAAFRTGVPASRFGRSLLIIASICVAVFSRFGEDIEPWVAWLAIMRVEPSGDMVLWNATPLAEVRRGELWRLVTPMFLHFSSLHLIFNMLWLASLGRQVEERHGSWSFLALVLLWSACSNILQFLFTGEPLFGGMSGVNFALFCYIWLRARYDPTNHFSMPSGTVALMLAWFFICLTGWLGPIANGAHIGGLLAGGATALLAMAWQRRRRSNTHA
ncbi:MAG: rhomboid family intramembrane serine protease [Pirellulales bacterium]|nr:rhomboid family intramembrane serine protease [Pirellulales bacterium]